VSSFSFIDKIFKQIDKLIEEGNLDKADEEITHFFSVYGNNLELLKNSINCLENTIFQGATDLSLWNI